MQFCSWYIILMCYETTKWHEVVREFFLSCFKYKIKYLFKSMNVKLGLKAADLLPRILIRTVTINTVCYVFKDRRLFFWHYSAECLGIEIREDL